MYKKIVIFILLPGFFWMTIGCREKAPKPESLEIDMVDEGVSTEKVRQIFYHMYLPSEMTRLFERSGSNFDPSIPNASDKFSRYMSHDTIALNLGIYGVDLGYTRIFDQTLSSAKYLEAIQLLSSRMGVPGNYYQDLLLAFEKHNQNKDSLAGLVGAIYQRADQYLRENERAEYSAMIILGGWIEAIYIACRIAENNPDNIEIIERIAEQKYSLNSIISLLNNFQEDESIAKNLLMLKQLKKSFDRISITYQQKDFKIDTVNKMISAKNLKVDIPPHTIPEIGNLVSQIRGSIVN